MGPGDLSAALFPSSGSEANEEAIMVVPHTLVLRLEISASGTEQMIFQDL